MSRVINGGRYLNFQQVTIPNETQAEREAREAEWQAKALEWERQRPEREAREQAERESRYASYRELSTKELMAKLNDQLSTYDEVDGDMVVMSEILMERLS